MVSMWDTMLISLTRIILSNCVDVSNIMYIYTVDYTSVKLGRKWKSAERKKKSTESSIYNKVSIKNEEEIKTFPDKQKLKELSPLAQPYKKCLKDSFKLKWKDDGQ